MAFGFGFGMGFPLRNTVVAPTLSMNFAGNPTLPATVDFTRGTNATFTNSAGNLQLTAGVNDPRFDYNPTTLVCKGLLIESQRTNSVRNNTMVGAVAGTPGTAPTNWITPTVVAGVISSIVGTGTESGITYIDIRFAGTTTSALFFSNIYETTVSTAPNSIWTNSAYIRLIGGSLSGISAVKLVIQNFDSVGASLGQFLVSTITPTSASLFSQRYSQTSLSTTFSNVNTAFVKPYFQIEAPTLTTIDVTLRIGLPQLELGQFATSVIPTSTAAATRNADLATMTGTNFSSWYNQDQSTVVTKIVQGVQGSATATANPGLFALRTASLGATFNGYGSREVLNVSGAGTIRVAGRSGATIAESSGPSLGFLAAGTSYTTAASFNASTISIAVNGAAGSTGSNTVSLLLLPRDTLDIGKQIVGGFTPYELNGHVASFTYYPMSLSMATLQALSV